MPPLPQPLIDLSPDNWCIVRDILQQHVPTRDVWAFGSRAKWTAKEYSDLDLAIMGSDPLDLGTLASLREAFQESDLPFKVDLVDWATTSPSFQAIIEQDKVVVKMSEWRTTRLRDISLLITKGTTPTTNGDGFSSVGINYIKSECLSYDGRIDTSKFSKITVETHEKLKRSQIHDSDILYSIAGVNLGKCGIAEAKYLPANTNQAVAIIRINPVLADPDYIAFSLRNPSFVRAVNAGVAQSAQPNVNLGEIGNFELLLPPIDEQHRISYFLTLLDERIGTLHQQNETLEAMARGIFKSWFVDFDPVRAKAEGRTPEGMDAPTAALFPSTFTDSSLGPIPERWNAGTLGQICNQQRRGIDPSSLSVAVPYIGLEHLPKRSIALAEWDSSNGLESGKLSFSEGEILFGKLRPYFHKVGVAPLDGICSTDILVVKPVAPKWFGQSLCVLSSDELITYATQLSNGARMPRVSWADLAKYPIVIPPDVVATAFHAQIKGYIAKIIANIHQSVSLRDLRDTLLPRLISGKLRLTDAQALTEDAA